MGHSESKSASAEEKPRMKQSVTKRLLRIIVCGSSRSKQIGAADDSSVAQLEERMRQLDLRRTRSLPTAEQLAVRQAATADVKSTTPAPLPARGDVEPSPQSSDITDAGYSEYLSPFSLQSLLTPQGALVDDAEAMLDWDDSAVCDMMLTEEDPYSQPATQQPYSEPPSLLSSQPFPPQLVTSQFDYQPFLSPQTPSTEFQYVPQQEPTSPECEYQPISTAPVYTHMYRPSAADLDALYRLHKMINDNYNFPEATADQSRKRALLVVNLLPESVFDLSTVDPSQGDSCLHLFIKVRSWIVDQLTVDRRHLLTAYFERAARHGKDPHIAPIRWDTPNKLPETPLFLAVKLDLIDVADTLLARGADPMLRCTDREETSLHQAVRRKNAAIIDVILGHARRRSSRMFQELFNAKDAEGCTASDLAFAREAKGDEWKEITKQLLSYNATQSCGQLPVPYDIACDVVAEALDREPFPFIDEQYQPPMDSRQVLLTTY